MPFYIMSNLLIKDINTISLSNIYIYEYPNHYKLNYSKNNISLNGLSFSCTSEIIQLSSQKYFVKLKETKDIKFIQDLDTYLSSKLINFSKILQEHDNNHGIIFHENTIVSDKFKDLPTKLYLNLKYINKGYYNNPILHIIY